MPSEDIATLSVKYVVDNIRYALQVCIRPRACPRVPWGAGHPLLTLRLLPVSVFFPQTCPPERAVLFDRNSDFLLNTSGRGLSNAGVGLNAAPKASS